MKALIENKIKAIAGAVVAALTAYIGTAITTGNALTAHGAELAAVGAVLTFLGVHQAPKNRENPAAKKRSTRPARDAGYGLIELLVVVILVLVLIGVLARWH